MAFRYDLRDYVKTYSVMSPEYCDSIIKIIGSEQFAPSWEKHTFYNPTNETYDSKSGNDELEVLSAFSTPELNQTVWNTIHKYTLEDFADYKQWWDGWNGFSAPRMNRYSVGQTMAIHCDHIHSMFDGTRKGIPVLTILGLLNDDFTGGEFKLFDDVTMEFKKGDIMIFPSSFMFPHYVTPVKTGTRYSFVSWTW